MSAQLQGVESLSYSRLLEDAARAYEVYSYTQDVADAAFNRANELQRKAERFRRRHLTLEMPPPVSMVIL